MSPPRPSRPRRRVWVPHNKEKEYPAADLEVARAVGTMVTDIQGRLEGALKGPASGPAT